MQVDDALLTKLEKLSFLKVSDDKREEIIGQLSEIVSFVDNLSELNTDGVDDNFAMSNKGTFTREDSPACDKNIHNDILKKCTSKWVTIFFIGPKINLNYHQ